MDNQSSRTGPDPAGPYLPVYPESNHRTAVSVHPVVQ